MKKLYLLFIISIIAFGQLFAQDDQTKSEEVEEKSASVVIIENTRALYDLGRMYSIPKYILKSKFSNFDFVHSEITEIDKVNTPEAYKFLVLSYIFLDEDEKADAAMLRLLKENNLFRPNPETDPAELHNLYNTYRTWPIFRIGLVYGANVSFTEVTEAYGSYNFSNTEETGTYDPSFGILNIGLQFEKDFLQRMITVETDFIYGTTANSYSQFSGSLNDGSGEFRISRESEKESLTFLGGNALVQYHPFSKNYNTAKWKPYIFAGGAANFLMKSTLDNTTTTKIEGGTPPTTDAELFGKQADEATANNLVMRNRDNYYIIGGLGVKRQIGALHLFLNAQYNYGLNDLTIKHINPSDPYKAHNGIKIHYAQLNFGGALSIYKPKKLTH